jgi:Spy/CpxP family protein refolding chaperone
MTNELNDQNTAIAKSTRSPWARRLIIGGVAAIVVIGAGVTAFAAGDGPGHWGGKFMRGFMEYRINQALTDAGADTAQKDKIKAIFKSTMDEVRPSRDDRKGMREEVIKILEAPTIDRNAIEALRVKRVADMDARSKVIAKAVGDAAEVLTQEQRKKLIDDFGDFGPGGPGGPDMMDHD